MNPQPNNLPTKSKFRSGIFIRSSLLASLAALVLCPVLALGAPQNINGELTTSDFLATDSSTNTYHYDLYELSNPTASSITVNITIDAGPNLSPWSASWSYSPLPTPNWASPTDLFSAVEQYWFNSNPGSILTYNSFELPAGATYQLAITTWDYKENGAPLDTYLLSVEGEGVEVSAIPEPSSVPLASTSIIALEDENVPDGGGTFFFFRNPVLNDMGQVAFSVSLDDTPNGTFDNEAVYRGTSSATLSKIVRTNESFGGDIVGDLYSASSINNNGQVAIYGAMATTDDILLRSSADGLSLTEIASRGDTTPTGDGEFDFFDTIVINTSGTVAFYAGLMNTTNPNEFEALYKSDGTTTTKIVRSADQAAVVGDTLIIESLSFNDSGQVAFYADTFAGDVVLQRGDGTTLTEIYRNGDPVPDGGGGTFEFPSFPTMNESGDIAFGTSLDADFELDTGIYRTVNGTLEKIMREGDAAPEGPGTFSSYREVPIINDSGNVAFIASLRDTPGGIYDDVGVYLSDGSTIMQIACEGDTAPGGIAQFSFFEDLAFNNHGQVVFQATLRLSAGSSSIGEGLYFYDPIEGLMKIAREGDALLGSTINFVGYASFSLSALSIESTGFNDAGQVAFKFQLEDGREGIALWSGPNRSVASVSPVITSFASVGVNTWELTLQGEADTAYEFRSSATLDFTPGTLVESLVQGDAPNDPGTITGGNQLTLDSNGDGKVRMTLTGSKNFVRAQPPLSP